MDLGKGLWLWIFLLGWIEFGACRSRRNPVCNEEQQNKMNKEFQECLSKFTKEHHEATGKASKPEEFQKLTCKLLEDTEKCGALWKRCHSPSEVRSIQDTHIQARISQFRDNSDGIDVFKCPVVEDYISSGRADRVDQSTEGACTVSEVADVQRDFSSCSHELSVKLYEEIQTLQEKRYARATNDLESELELEDSEVPALDPIKDLKPKLCETLHKIANQCIETFKKCFSREDSNQIQRQHVDQMASYYSNIYEGVGNLTDCPQIKLLKKDLLDEYNEITKDDENYSYSDEEYNYDDEDYSVNSDKVKPTTSNPAIGTSAELNPKYSGRSAESFGYSEDDHQTPVPESGPVIAEPPTFLEAGHSGASSLNSQTVNVFVLCFVLFVQAWLIG